MRRGPARHATLRKRLESGSASLRWMNPCSIVYTFEHGSQAHRVAQGTATASHARRGDRPAGGDEPIRNSAWKLAAVLYARLAEPPGAVLGLVPQAELGDGSARAGCHHDDAIAGREVLRLQ